MLAKGIMLFLALAKSGYPMYITIEKTAIIGNHWTVDVNESILGPRFVYKYIAVCAILPKGVISGGGDNCDIHDSLEHDAIYCAYFDKESVCRGGFDPRYQTCGMSWGCQNLEAPVLEWIANKKSKRKP